MRSRFRLPCPKITGAKDPWMFFREGLHKNRRPSCLVLQAVQRYKRLLHSYVKQLNIRTDFLSTMHRRLAPTLLLWRCVNFPLSQTAFAGHDHATLKSDESRWLRHGGPGDPLPSDTGQVQEMVCHVGRAGEKKSTAKRQEMRSQWRISLRIAN